jgi:hypothetical protein
MNPAISSISHQRLSAALSPAFAFKDRSAATPRSKAENFLRTEGLLAINNSIMRDISAFRELKIKLEGRIVLFAVDLAPLDYRTYFGEMLSGLSYRGLVIHWIYSPV